MAVTSFHAERRVLADAVQQMALLRQTQVAAAVAALDDADREEDAAVETLGRGDADVEMTSQHGASQRVTFDHVCLTSRAPHLVSESLKNSSSIPPHLLLV